MKQQKLIDTINELFPKPKLFPWKSSMAVKLVFGFEALKTYTQMAYPSLISMALVVILRSTAS